MAEVAASADSDVRYKLRSYQEEMVDVSLRENVVVKQDTGSGKTLIAIARADAALKHSDSSKLVWLIAPTVPLCIQHAETFRLHLPAYQLRLLLGSDGIDRWSHQTIWDAALKNIRIVVSTAAVLRDALDHTFVHLEDLALLIFDEAHHCQKNHAGAQIMRNWYENSLSLGRPVPSILGLSASIVKPAELEKLLHARVITPSRCRAELLHHANRPVLDYVSYYQGGTDHSSKLACLESIKDNYDFLKDPWYMKSSRERSPDSPIQPTFCLKEIMTLHTRASHIYHQLGPTYADWYLETSVRSIITYVEHNPRDLAYSGRGLSREEANYLVTLLRPVLSQKRKCDDTVDDRECKQTLTQYSNKVEKLVQYLDDEWTDNLTGIIFVQQRALAHVLALLLSKHRFQRGDLRVRGFVGSSSNLDPTKRLAERVIPKDQNDVLEKFRSSEINLIVSTEVLGEGVDIPQCHMVMAFDLPPQMVSYVQKRGRARQKDSKYVLFFQEGEDHSKIVQWQKLERELDVVYQNAEREWDLAQSLEQRCEPDNKEFRAPSSGALLNFDNAMAKLHHFCQTLRSGPALDLRPQFDTQEILEERKVTAMVTLPTVVQPELRVGKSSQAWLTERTAKKDAAFEILKRLYEAGLLNDNLLPLREPPILPAIEEVGQPKRSLCYIHPRLNPWIDIANSLNAGTMQELGYEITIQRRGVQNQAIKFMLHTTRPLPTLPETTLYWNTKIHFQVIGKPLQTTAVSTEQSVRDSTQLFRHVYGSRMPSSHIRMLVIVSDVQGDVDLSIDGRAGSSKRRPRVLLYDDRRYLTLGSEDDSPSEFPQSEVMIKAYNFPKRRDFLHSTSEHSKNASTTEYDLPEKDCKEDSLDHNAAIAVLFLPSILRRLELAMVTEHLAKHLLASVRFGNMALLQTAITHNAAREVENYQCLEFLGDCILKYLTTINLMVEHPQWPEGYLTAEKSRLVSNENLHTACIDVGLDKYIIYDQFTGLKWQPHYVHSVLEEATKPVVKVNRSSKMVVADVIESTIGAAYLDGGIDAAIKICRIYFPKTKWTSPEAEAAQLYQTTSNEAVNLDGLECLIGYKFRKPALLLEAVTSQSFRFDRDTARSYERLEFLGDAVLDYLVVQRMFEQKHAIPHYRMHLIRAAVVNEYILGYLCMTHSATESREDIVMTRDSEIDEDCAEVKHSGIHRFIWEFCRHSQALDVFKPSLTRFEDLGKDIGGALENDSVYPWGLLSRFGPSKMFSDLMEAIIGAIFVDSGADQDVCNRFLDRIGLNRILDRIMMEEVHCKHPKEQLGVVAKQRKVQYIWDKEDDLCTCQVQIGGVTYGALAKGETREATGCQAALAALAVLERDERMIVQEFDVKALYEDEDTGVAAVSQDCATPDDGGEYKDIED